MAEVTVSSTWKSAQPRPVNTLVDKVCDLYGLTGDDEAKKQALDCLDDTVKELNMQVWEFNIVTATGLAITADQRYITLPTLFYKEKLAYLVGSDNSVPYGPLGYLDWASFERLYSKTVGSPSPGVPRVYSVKNQAREGLLYFGPTPSSSDNTLTLQYYRRIEVPSQNDQLVVPEEVESVLLYGARRRFAELIEGPDASAVVQLYQLYQQSFDKLQAMDRRHPDELTRFRLYGHARQEANNTIFVRI